MDFIVNIVVMIGCIIGMVVGGMILLSLAIMIIKSIS